MTRRVQKSRLRQCQTPLNDSCSYVRLFSFLPTLGLFCLNLAYPVKMTMLFSANMSNIQVVPDEEELIGDDERPRYSRVENL